MVVDGTRQTELDEFSPSWVNRVLTDETTPPEWADVDTYRPERPFTDDKWIRGNGWRKWHAERDCGAETVYLIEDSLSQSSTTQEHRLWTLYCARCGSVNWNEIVYLKREWYYDQFEQGKLPYSEMESFDNLWLKPELLLTVGGVPSSEEVREIIQKSIAEQAERRKELSERIGDTT